MVAGRRWQRLRERRVSRRIYEAVKIFDPRA